ANGTQPRHDAAPAGRGQCIIVRRAIHFLNSVEGSGQRSLKKLKQFVQTLAFEYREHDVLIAIASVRVDRGIPEIDLGKKCCQWRDVFSGDDPRDHLSVCNSFFDDHTHQDAYRKSSGVRNVAYPVVEMLKNLSYRHQPDKRFEKTHNGCRGFSAAQDVNDSDGVD